MRNVKKNAQQKRRVPLYYVCGATVDSINIYFLEPFPIHLCGNEDIMAIIDQFNKWVELCSTRSEQCNHSKRLVEKFITRFRVPMEIHTDQGRNFQSDMFKNVYKFIGGYQDQDHPYHPAHKAQDSRDGQLPLILALYRSTPHRSIGVSLNAIMMR